MRDAKEDAMEEIKVFFFSATGNSLYVANKFTPHPLSIPQEMRKADRDYSADSIGFVCPVYYGEIPEYVQNFMATSVFKARYFFFVLTYGSSPMIAPQFAAECAKKLGINIDYAVAILMVDNYLPNFDMEAEKKIDKHVDRQIEEAIRNVNARKTGVPEPTGSELMWYERVRQFNRDNPAFNNGSQITMTDRCIGCGVCTRVCPQGNCYLEAGRAQRKNTTCAFCMACIQNCPVKAISLSIQDKNPEARYRNSHVTVKQLEAANCQIC